MGPDSHLASFLRSQRSFAYLRANHHLIDQLIPVRHAALAPLIFRFLKRTKNLQWTGGEIEVTPKGYDLHLVVELKTLVFRDLSQGWLAAILLWYFSIPVPRALDWKVCERLLRVSARDSIRKDHARAEPNPTPHIPERKSKYDLILNLTQSDMHLECLDCKAKFFRPGSAGCHCTGDKSASYEPVANRVRVIFRGISIRSREQILYALRGRSRD